MTSSAPLAVPSPISWPPSEYWYEWSPFAELLFTHTDGNAATGMVMMALGHLSGCGWEAQSRRCACSSQPLGRQLGSLLLKVAQLAGLVLTPL